MSTRADRHREGRDGPPAGARGRGGRRGWAWLARVTLGGLLAGYLLWVAYPLVWMAYSSFKTDAAIFRAPFAWPEPGEWQPDNYRQAWTEARLGDYLLNSLVVTSVAVSLIVLLGARAAYALTRFAHPFSSVVQALFLAGLMIPLQLSLVPLFFELRALGLLNSRVGLILVYVANGLPFAIFVLAGFFKTLPRSLYEAALLDGCSPAQVFWRVYLPLARPGLATVAIFQFIAVWKEYFIAFMLLNGEAGAAARTLPLGLAQLAITAQYRSDQGLLFAGLMIVTLPILVVYLVLQQQLVKGLTAGAVKG